MRNLLTVAVLAVTVAPALHAASEPILHIGGDVAKPADWTNAQLSDGKAGAPPVIVHYTLKGVAHTANCIPLLALIQAAEPSFNPHIKNHRLQFVVAVQGFHGYTVDFSLPEMLPELGNKAVWIALDEDGKPLTAEGGAAGLIAPDDVKPGRWVRGVTRITVIDGAKNAG
ncbi:hypothetical protein CCAX7_24580 [Capsulimonas corticalis]|uniref:Uncharacterized protein n=1 Tax=Capsulimonas corticalis TaxID=2219043 RepID=A0A402CVI0_9BACT|nr:hypothetical protein [Capsulimonas corticalis]BDI30407.1 hypothetical protein CCAX7_24580 [Capsulimonas corticalis]